MNFESKLKIKLKILALKIKDEINLNKSLIQPILTPQISLAYHEDTSKGLKVKTVSIIKDGAKFYLFSDSIRDTVVKSQEYESIRHLLNSSDCFLDENHLLQFILKIGQTIINEPTVNQDQEGNICETIIDDIIRVFTNDIYDRQVNAKTIVKIEGITLLIERLEMHSGHLKTALRSATKNDLQNTYAANNINIFNFNFNQFSSILELEHYDLDTSSVQIEVNKTIAVLRLFKVASVKYNYYETIRETILESRTKGTECIIEPNRNSHLLSDIYIDEENYLELVNHYNALYKFISDYICTSEVTDINNYIPSYDVFYPSLKVSYQHYSDALVRRIEQEEKIMSAVIGLESILISESGENTLRLWLRGAKILGFFHESPMTIKKVLTSAYSVRSSFVHGDGKRFKKYSKKSDKDIQDEAKQNILLVNLLECLRVLIILTIFLSTKDEFIDKQDGVKRFKKNYFLNMVDNSLIDKENEKHLKEILDEFNQVFDIKLSLKSLSDLD